MELFTSFLLIIDHHQQVLIDELHLMRSQSTSWQRSHLTYELIMGKHTLPLQQAVMFHAGSTHCKLKHTQVEIKTSSRSVSRGQP